MDKTFDQVTAALRDCVSVMERDLNGLAVIQPELQQAREALACVLAPGLAWNGEGLPPVDTVCEYSPFRDSWHPVKVFALKPNGNGSTSALFEREKGWGACADPKCFRPIRTPEKSAAEEREQAIKDMCDVMDGADDDLDCAQRLHAAGYRKITE